MATIKGGRIFKFKLFGFSFLIWKNPKDTRRRSGGGCAANSCKLVKHGRYIALAMPDGTVIPNQVDLEVKAPLHDIATATVEVFVSID